MQAVDTNSWATEDGGNIKRQGLLGEVFSGALPWKGLLYLYPFSVSLCFLGTMK